MEVADADPVAGTVSGAGRKLARIVRIDSIAPIPKAERVMQATVCGWSIGWFVFLIDINYFVLIHFSCSCEAQ
jgi:hypothetical protein